MKLARAMKGWEELEKFSCRDIASIVGVFQSFEGVLRCLGKFLGKLYAWKTECERTVRKSDTLTKKSRLFTHDSLFRMLTEVVGFLDARDWSVPLVDWEGCVGQPEMVMYADAAAPKKLGTAYVGDVWGKGAYTFSVMRDKAKKQPKGFYYSQKHTSDVIKMGMREKALSSPLLELENYVFGAVALAKVQGARRVVIVGDSKTALDDWLDKGIPRDEHAARLIRWFWGKQLEMGLLVRTERKSNKEWEIKLADRLSRGDTQTHKQLERIGFERRQFEQPRY